MLQVLQQMNKILNWASTVTNSPLSEHFFRRLPKLGNISVITLPGILPQTNKGQNGSHALTPLFLQRSVSDCTGPFLALLTPLKKTNIANLTNVFSSFIWKCMEVPNLEVKIKSQNRRGH
jgi:hypothetical protein